MDAQHSREHGCHQHLHGQWHPANKQAYRNASGHRAPIKVPDHRVGNGIPDPAPQWVRFIVRATNLLTQLSSDRSWVRQIPVKPVTGHSEYTDGRNGKPQHNNVVVRILLNYSVRNAEGYSAI